VTTDQPLTADAYCEAGVKLLKSGAALMAYDTFAEGLRRYPADARLRQQLALSLARTGASRLANQILQELAAEGHKDEETLGLLARTHKDLWADSDDRSEQRRHLRLAFEYYRDAYTLTNGYWSGINAATMALLLDLRAEAETLAQRVRAQCLSLHKEETHHGSLYWVLATLGEAALILGNWREAEERYSQAMPFAPRRYGDLASTRRNARLIIRHLQGDGSRIENCFRVPRVVVFAGHLIDRPDRAYPRFPAWLEPIVRAAIRDSLQSIDAGFGYSSAGCGGDILFLETLQELNGEPHIVLPYDRDQFKQDSVDIVPGADWPARFERLLSSAKEVVTASEERMAEGGMSYEYGFLMLDGTAGVRADELDTDLVCLAAWDGGAGDGPGGTASSVERWRRAGRRLEIIDVAALLQRERSAIVIAPEVRTALAGVQTAAAATTVQARASSAFEPEIKGLLFADVRGFSKLSEEEIPLFVEHFLGAVAAELKRSSHAPILANTWGDGLYFVFDSVRSTGEFALGLCEAVRAIDWRAKGFRHDLSLRIGLHAGPVYSCVDPVTNRPNYIGAHVSRAARIEPITPPGEVYASRAFAALARSEEIKEFVCSYVGQTPLAKGYGTYPTYVVHRRRR
jgi:class 3 adenylate cyclase/tetratricopeptide (TPR) repeat protein